MDVREGIFTRRSIRKFVRDKNVSPDILNDICRAGIMAPSAHNRQPWKIMIVSDNDRVRKIAKCSVNYLWAKNASAMIVVFLDKIKIYDYIKDVQSAGALIQNMLLYAHSVGVATCWIGDVLNNPQINDVLEMSTEVELMAVIALGYAQQEEQNVFEHRSLGEFLL